MRAEKRQRILDYIGANPGCSTSSIPKGAGVSEGRIARDLAEMAEAGAIGFQRGPGLRKAWYTTNEIFLQYVTPEPREPRASILPQYAWALPKSPDGHIPPKPPLTHIRDINDIQRPQRILICPDVHVPYHDGLAWETFLTVGREWRPDILVILGDFADFYQVSDYPHDPNRRLTFQDEVRLTNEELDRVMSLHVPRVIFLEGNHETRLARLIQRESRALHGVVDVKQLFHIEARRFEWVPYTHHATIGKLNFAHDVGRSGVYAARQSVQDFGHNIIFGHTHRAACHYENTVLGEKHVGWTMGWLGDPNAIDYRHRSRVLRENQHGFGVAYMDETGVGWVNFVPIISGRACVDGRIYSGRKAGA